MYKELKDDIEGFIPPDHGYLVGWAVQGNIEGYACNDVYGVLFGRSFTAQCLFNCTRGKIKFTCRKGIRPPFTLGVCVYVYDIMILTGLGKTYRCSNLLA